MCHLPFCKFRIYAEQTFCGTYGILRQVALPRPVGRRPSETGRLQPFPRFIVGYLVIHNLEPVSFAVQDKFSAVKMNFLVPVPVVRLNP